MDIEQKLRKIDEVLSRGVGEFIDPNDAFRTKLVAKAKGEYGKDIIVKLGVDPTRPDIHLGHAVILRKLRMLQDLGCKVIFLIGDFTAQIGDPTGKSKVRPEVDQREVEANMQTYLEQVGKILLVDKAVFSWIRNSDWYQNVTDIEPKPGSLVRFRTTLVNPNSFVGKAILFDETRMQKTHLKNPHVVNVSLKNLLSVLRKITHARLIERDMFKDRLGRGEELYMHEMLYPVLQGVDSHVLHLVYGSCDLEIGGTDQTFNMLVGRDVMKMNDQEPQSVLSVKLLEGTDGSEKMSKSLDNYISVIDEPFDMFGKVMSVPDKSLVNYYELCTYTPRERVAEIAKEIEGGSVNPRDIKMELAEQIVTLYHGSEASRTAKEGFVSTFSKGGVPENVEQVTVKKGKHLSDVLSENGIVSSKSEWRRLVDEGAVKDMEKDEAITDPFYEVNGNLTVKVGKRRFLKITAE